jgi:hypothetical protein
MDALYADLEDGIPAYVVRRAISTIGPMGPGRAID